MYWSLIPQRLFSFPPVSLLAVLIVLVASVNLTAQDSLNFKPVPDSGSANEFSKYLGSMYQHLLSRRRRSGLIACSGNCEPLSLGKESIPGSEATGFKIIRKELTWQQAHDECEENHGHMASFLDEKTAKQVIEAIFLKSTFSNDYDWGKKREEFGLDRRYWIGLTDIMAEGKWAWVGKGKFLTYNKLWYPNQPDHVFPDGRIKNGRRQHCVCLWNPTFYETDKENKPTQRHTFDDLECDQKLYAICEDDPAMIEMRKKAMVETGKEEGEKKKEK